MKKLNVQCIIAYEEKFPSDWIGYMEPSDIIGIESNGISVVQPDDETEHSFMERLKRCTEDHNVFLQEWEIDDSDSDIDM